MSAPTIAGSCDTSTDPAGPPAAGSPSLVTTRLDLRPIDTADADTLFALFREPHVRRYLLDGLNVDRSFVLDEILSSEARFLAGCCGLYGMRRGESFVGFVGMRPFGEPLELELLFAIRHSFLGQGYATEGAARIIEALRRTQNATLHASTDEPNIASIRVLEKLNFKLIRRTNGADWPQLHYELKQ